MIDLKAINFGSLFVSVTDDDGSSKPNRTVRVFPTGSVQRILVSGNYNTVLPPGDYSAEAADGVSLGDCGTLEESPEYRIGCCPAVRFGRALDGCTITSAVATMKHRAMN